MKNVWIYALKDNGRIFYIGQTIRVYQRLEQHVQQAKRSNKTILDKRINDIFNNNRQLTIVILLGCNNINSHLKERETVETYLNNGLK